MKKVLLLCVVMAGFVIFNSATGQSKIGYINEQGILYAMPGFAKVDTLINNYRLDSLQEEYKYNVADYQRKDSIFKKDSATMPAKAREIATRDLLQLRYKLVNWQQYEQQMLEARYDQLSAPFKMKVADALAAVIAEQKYTLILKEEALSTLAVPALLDNVTIRVAKKLNLPLPKEMEDAWRIATGGGSGAPASKPPVKPAGKG